MAFLHEHIILPLSDLITHQHVYHDMKFLRNCDQWSEQQMLDFRCEKLRSIINYAITYVPYYRNLGLTIDCVRNLEDLRKIPIVSKHLIREQGLQNFLSEDYPISRRIIMHSSGSTGVIVLETNM